MNKKVPKQKIQAGSSSLLKGEILKWMFSILFSSVAYAFVAYLISIYYHPDVKELLDYVTKITFSGNPKPEPMESLLVKLGMVLIPTFILLSYYLFNKLEIIKKIANSSSFNYITTFIVLVIAFVIYQDFAANNPFSGDKAENIRDVECKTNYEFFFRELFLGSHLLLYTFIIVPIIYSLFLFGLKKYNWEKKSFYNFFFLVPGNLFIAGLILCIVVIHTFLFPYTYENKYDFNAVYYSMTQVYAGSPMLVDGFTNTYGLYPHFLNLIFQVIGLSILKFTLVLSLLLGLSFTLNFFFLKRYVSNKLILFLGITSVIIYPYLGASFLLINFGAAFSFWPIRWLIPSLLFFLTGWYLSKKSKKIYYLTFGLMGIFVLWNPEIGILSYITWVLINVYNDFYDEAKKINIKKMIQHVVIGATCLFVIFNLYKLIIFISYGKVPDVSLLFTYIILFGKTGFASLPMVLIHPWNIVSIIYMISILYVIVKWLQKDITPKSVIILLLTVLGFGFFLYFQGRSHNFQFFNATIPCFFLLPILGDILWEHVRTKNLIALNALFFVFVYIISFSFFDILSNTKKIKEQFYQTNDRIKNQEEENQLKSNENFIVRNTLPNEKNYTLTAWHYQGLYYNGNKIKSAFNPSILEVVLYSDLRRWEKDIIDSSFTVFFEPDYCNYLFMPRPIAAVAAKYKIEGTNRSMFLLRPIKNKIPEAEYLKPDNSTLFHSKYTSDSVGIKTRVDHSEGIEPISLPQEFSVELIFKPQQQVYKFATLIGNMTDTAGFLIANEKGTDNYYFGTNGKSYSVPVINKGWVYCVMNVFSNKMEIYQNGTLTHTLLLQEPYKNTNQKIGIGNIGAWRYYLGQIAETSINKKVFSNQEVHDRWIEMEKINEIKK